MSSFIVKYVTNRIIKGNQWNRFGVEDPYYEHIVAGTDRKGQPKYKRIKRRIPEGLTPNDLRVLKTFKKKAVRYDMWFNFLGVKFGWTSVVLLVPVLGPIVSTYWSLKLLMLLRLLDDGFPLDLQLLFIVNVIINFLLGLIPVVGSIVEMGYKANSRNYLLLEKHLERVGQKNLGKISENEVRPGFINDKVQPYVEHKVVPGAIKAGESIKSFLDSKPTKSGATSATLEVTLSPRSIDELKDSDKASIRSIQTMSAYLDEKEATRG